LIYATVTESLLIRILTNKYMEGAFKFLFFLAVLVFCVTIVGIFLLICKIILLFQPQIQLMGLIIKTVW
jgi:hypothetical protein